MRSFIRISIMAIAVILSGFCQESVDLGNQKIQDKGPYLVDLAEVHIRYNQFQKAEELLLNAEKTATGKTRLELFELMANLYKRSNRLEKAIEIEEKLLSELKDKDPRKGRILNDLIRWHLEKKQLQEAKSYLEQLTSQGSEWAKKAARRLWVNYHSQAGTLDTYVNELESKIKGEHPEPEALKALAVVYESPKAQKDAPQKAIDVFKQLHKLEPNETTHTFHLGKAYESAEMYSEAVNLYEQEYEKDPVRHKHLIRNIIDLEIKAGRKEAAAQWADKLYENTGAPNHRLLIDKARTLQQVGAYEKSLDALKSASGLAKTPKEKADIEFRKVDALRHLKRRDDAEKTLRAMLADETIQQVDKTRAKQILFDILDKSGKLKNVKIEK